MTTKTDGTDEPADPTQVTAPTVDTSTPIWRWITFENAPFLLPSVLGVVGGIVAIPFLGLFVAGAVFTGTMVWMAAVYTVSKQTSDRTSPMWKARDAIAFNRLRLAMPWTHAEVAASKIHQVEGIYTDGTVETTDGRLVGAVRFDGVNTADMTESERNRMVADLSAAVDEEIKDFDFRFYSTTDDFDPERIVGQYDREARSSRLQRPGMEYVREMFNAVYEWFIGADQPTWQAREWRHYVIVEASVGEHRARYGDLEGENTDETGTDGIDAAVFAELKADLEDRLGIVRRDVTGSVDGCSATDVGRREMAALLRRFWSGQSPTDYLRDATDEDGEEIAPTEAVDDSQVTVSRSPDQLAEDLGLAASHIDVKRGLVEIGQQVARTYWVAGWDPSPRSMFLRDLYTLRDDVDVDVCIHNRALDRELVKDALRYDIRDLNVEQADRGTDISSLDVSESKKSYIRLYQQLAAEVTQPWAINGYITVRAGDRSTLDALEDDLEESRGFDVLKRRYLEDSAESVRKAVEGTPANLTLTGPGLRQKEAFVASSPVGSDQYNEAVDGTDWMHGVRQLFGAENTGDVIEGGRSTLAGGGAVGAMFPFCSAIVQDENGTLWGRNTQNGSPITVDEFDRGSSGHTLTIGKTRHGKTYAETLIDGRWFNERGDRTLIVADTQKGFTGLTEYCNGRHVVIDGSTPINPLAISAPDDAYSVGRGDSDPVRLKVEEVAQFITGVLSAQGVSNTGDYVSSIEEIAMRTYRREGITPGDPASLENPSPDMMDYLDVASDMIHSTGEYTISGHEAETGIKRDRLAELLDYLSGFRPNGKYHALLGGEGEDENMVDTMGLGLADPDVDMVYLDLSETNVETSVMLQLVLGQVSQAIRKAPGQSKFVADEAHVLMHDERAVDWVTRAAREYARFESALSLISQHPSEFLASGSSDDKEVFKDQCSIIRFFRTPGVNVDVLERFGMNEKQADRVRNGLVPGRAGKGYSECLINLQDHQGWIPMRVEASPFEDMLLNYDPNEDGEFAQYVADEWGGEQFEQLAANLEDDQKDTGDENPDTIAKPVLADD
ncbi:hypothetical protein [Halalkalicoccus sp. NIPERK01]|uniref:hypothetical protein n=1 Tax=Halalkalicoccus sp. NIPERK01 TaxID=3053469 RepID=UPI00256EA189|nr:hypothetical protein [Halalkalicoccus sp. NIPERK01]MDL5363900.1 hypothetical protein [Halalkalicoccus sp. NIPERK01]